MKKLIYLLSVILCMYTAGCSENEAYNAAGNSIPTESVEIAVSDEPQSEQPQPSSQPTASVPESKSPISEKIPAPSLSNNIIGEETVQGISVYLPPSYDSSERQYPVLYFLPGYEDGYGLYMNTFSRSMDALLSDQEVNEMIVVTINGTNKFGGSFYYNSPVTGNWEDFVTKDVVSYVDNNYRTIKNADGRGIAGHSMGGFGVINIVMHTNGEFSYAYSMSPGVFDENGFSKSPLNFSNINRVINRYADLDNQAANTEYMTYITRLTWPMNFSFAYGSTFAGNPDIKAPYIMLPEQDEAGGYVHDDTWMLFNAGYGNLSEKIDEYKDNLLTLKSFVIEYGTQDEFSWIPEGCEYFSEQLSLRDIPHVLTNYDGDHQSKVNARIKSEVLPFFSKMFGA